MNFSSLDNYQQLVRYNKVRLIELLRLIGDLHYDNFQRTNIYSKIVTLEKSFTYEEQGILEKEIKCYFNVLIENLQKNCPALTLTEILICCLSLRFSVKTISLCFGYSNTNNLKQHKSRIKKKMTIDSDNAFLFDFIFKN